MIYQPSHSPESNLNKSISPESSIPIHIQSNSNPLDHKNVYNSRSSFIFPTSLQKTDNKNIEETNTNSNSKYIFSKSDCFDCIDIFDFEQDEQQLDIGYNNSDQGSSNDCYFSDDCESDFEGNQNYIENIYKCFDSNIDYDWGFEERTRPNEFSDVGDIIGYAKLVKAQRDAAMGELDSLLSQIDSVFGVIKKGFNIKKNQNNFSG
uniref:Uncharacterized protein n=1 Tax=Strongyloides papillosus TaxID=174720 RepID=A0A0N5C3W4_STREA